MDTQMAPYGCPTFFPTPLCLYCKEVKGEDAAACHPLADLVSKLTVQVYECPKNFSGVGNHAKNRPCFACARCVGAAGLPTYVIALFC